MEKSQNNKKKLAIISLTACEGCQAIILNLGQRFLDLIETDYELVEMPLIEDRPDVPEYDVVIVEGSAITDEDLKRLKTARQKSKILIALGACACLGGVPEIKNYTSKKKTIEHVYQNLKGIDNPEIKELRHIVKVDLEIPGCPPTKSEILWALQELAQDRIPQIPQKPVCSECPRRGLQECFLQQGKVCLGPIISAGCKAICPKSNYRCEGCRGPLKKQNQEAIKNLLGLFNKRASRKDINALLEKYGLKDDLNEQTN